MFRGGRERHRFFWRNRGRRKFLRRRRKSWSGQFLCRGDCGESDAKGQSDNLQTMIGDPRFKHNIASSRSGKCCPAFRSRVEILHRDYRDKLIVQTVEASKVIDRALGGVFTRSLVFIRNAQSLDCASKSSQASCLGTRLQVSVRFEPSAAYRPATSHIRRAAGLSWG